MNVDDRDSIDSFIFRYRGGSFATDRLDPREVPALLPRGPDGGYKQDPASTGVRGAREDGGRSQRYAERWRTAIDA